MHKSLLQPQNLTLFSPNCSCVGINDGCQTEHTPSRSVAVGSALSGTRSLEQLEKKRCLCCTYIWGEWHPMRTHSGNLWYPFNVGLLWFLTDPLSGPAVLHLCWKGGCCHPRSGGNTMEKEKCRAWGNTSDKAEAKTARQLGTIVFQQVGSYILFRHLTESK